ncbi:hypothetical protein PIB30_017090 [Stylosanthes scabra]|uniref:Uncharacterized protein n=1 Tax=Stylosanthes scabra TaxID=79078 RepID=A0ABU6T792_9FABA|nr:hypothetical protein [Stylosanthes scabra]
MGLGQWTLALMLGSYELALRKRMSRLGVKLPNVIWLKTCDLKWTSLDLILVTFEKLDFVKLTFEAGSSKRDLWQI